MFVKIVSLLKNVVDLGIKKKDVLSGQGKIKDVNFIKRGGDSNGKDREKTSNRY